jgi:undecaprenyl-phosphate 4-deoxy-4-formamido-L-arabinose transferase
VLNAWQNSPIALPEIILVNDGSTDGSARLCRELAQGNPQIKFLQLAKNVGQHNAILTGLRVASGSVVICMDDDLQHDPQDILTLVHALEEQHLDVIYAAFEEKKQGAFRNFGSQVNDWMLNVLLKKPKDLVISSFFAVRREIVDVMIQFHGPTVYLPGLTLRATSAIGNIPVTHHARQLGKSNYTFKKLLQLWLTGVMNFSVWPLRACTVFGSLLAALGFIFGLIILISKLIHPGIPVGYTSLLLLVVILGGINLIFVGVVGEYVGRLFMTLSQQPQSVITEKINL